MFTRLGTVLHALFASPANRSTAPPASETAADIRSYSERLLRSPNKTAFLRISPAGSEDFLQLSAVTGGVELNFPLITRRQLAREEAIRRIATRERLALTGTPERDGDQFLLFEVVGPASHVAAICEIFLRDVFDVRPNAALLFEHDGLATR